jgi:hypothetical protein
MRTVLTEKALAASQLEVERVQEGWKRTQLDHELDTEQREVRRAQEELAKERHRLAVCRKDHAAQQVPNADIRRNPGCSLQQDPEGVFLYCRREQDGEICSWFQGRPAGESGTQGYI